VPNHNEPNLCWRLAYLSENSQCVGTLACFVSFGGMSYVQTEAWSNARAAADYALGNIIDEFVMGNYHSVVAMCEFQLAQRARTGLTHSFTVRWLFDWAFVAVFV
jgi:lipoprotein signal peptidase